jgi:hypothetical protein
MIETYPLEKVAEAYARMMSGDAQFRVVLTIQVNAWEEKPWQTPFWSPARRAASAG